MKIINLTQNKQTIIDDEDYEYLNQFKWYFVRQGYAVRKSPRNHYKRKTLFLHRVILNPSTNEFVDHINGDKLDNRKCNLRVATKSQNGMNQKKQSKCSSIYKGVYFHKKSKRWMSRIMIEQRYIFLGYFDLEIDAAKAYNEAAIKYHGKFARLNEV